MWSHIACDFPYSAEAISRSTIRVYFTLLYMHFASERITMSKRVKTSASYSCYTTNAKQVMRSVCAHSVIQLHRHRHVLLYGTCPCTYSRDRDDSKAAVRVEPCSVQSTIYRHWMRRQEFSFGATTWGLVDGSHQWGPGESPIGGLRDEVPKKLKQLADIVYRFWLQKRSEFEYIANHLRRFLTSLLHGRD